MASDGMIGVVASLAHLEVSSVFAMLFCRYIKHKFNCIDRPEPYWDQGRGEEAYGRPRGNGEE